MLFRSLAVVDGGRKGETEVQGCDLLRSRRSIPRTRGIRRCWFGREKSREKGTPLPNPPPPNFVARSSTNACADASSYCRRHRRERVTVRALLSPESYGCCLTAVSSSRGRARCRSHRIPIVVDGEGITTAQLAMKADRKFSGRGGKVVDGISSSHLHFRRGNSLHAAHPPALPTSADASTALSLAFSSPLRPPTTTSSSLPATAKEEYVSWIGTFVGYKLHPRGSGPSLLSLFNSYTRRCFFKLLLPSGVVAVASEAAPAEKGRLRLGGGIGWQLPQIKGGGDGGGFRSVGGKMERKCWSTDLKTSHPSKLSLELSVIRIWQLPWILLLIFPHVDANEATEAIALVGEALEAAITDGTGPDLAHYPMEEPTFDRAYGQSNRGRASALAADYDPRRFDPVQCCRNLMAVNFSSGKGNFSLMKWLSIILATGTFLVAAKVVHLRFLPYLPNRKNPQCQEIHSLHSYDTNYIQNYFMESRSAVAEATARSGPYFSRPSIILDDQCPVLPMDCLDYLIVALGLIVSVIFMVFRHDRDLLGRFAWRCCTSKELLDSKYGVMEFWESEYWYLAVVLPPLHLGVSSFSSITKARSLSEERPSFLVTTHSYALPSWNSLEIRSWH
nr:uncharacterized protein LOC109171083 [Ipomoea batatas]